jgi:hypothetical protein
MADLSVQVTESVTLNGALRGGTNTVTTTGINDVFERIVLCTFGQETTIARFAATPYTDPVAIDLDLVKYVRVTNLDETEKLLLAVVTTASTSTVRLLPGGSFILTTGNEVIRGEEDAVPSFATLENLAALIIKPVSVSVSSRVSVFVASE